MPRRVSDYFKTAIRTDTILSRSPDARIADRISHELTTGAGTNVKSPKTDPVVRASVLLVAHGRPKGPSIFQMAVV